jgi:hypothetical protein
MNVGEGGETWLSVIVHKTALCVSTLYSIEWYENWWKINWEWFKRKQLVD